MRVELAYKPRKWQQQCHSRSRRFNVLALHRRAGKTEWAIMELIDRASAAVAELPLFLYLSPLLTQSRNNVWGRLKAKLSPLIEARAVEVREVAMEVRFLHNDAVIRLAGADNPDALRGLRLDGVVIDEVAQVKPEVWQEVVQPALSDRLGWAIFIGTPKGVNLFSELYFGAANKPDWHAARYTVYDTGALDKDEVERLRSPEVTSPNVFAREYLCDFAAAGDDQVLSLTEVEDSARKVYVERDVAHAARVIGVDVARFGDDRSVIVKRQGLAMIGEPLAFTGLDNMEMADRVAAVISTWKPDAVFIDSGAGAGVIDRLRQLRFDVIEVPFGGKANKPSLYINRRTEMWCDMAAWVRSGGAIFNSMALKEEMATPIYWYDNQGRKVLEPKDDIKKRLQTAKSPDIADALALTFASPVHKPEPLSHWQRGAAVVPDHNPYARQRGTVR
jgi:hypothetical protein